MKSPDEWVASIRLGGRKVVVSPLLEAGPVIKIPDHFQWCTDEYRARHNKWLLERFGAKEDRMVSSEDDKTLYISPSRARCFGLKKVE